MKFTVAMLEALAERYGRKEVSSLDGSTITRAILVEVNEGHLIHVQKPETSERRAVRSNEVLLGIDRMIGSEAWIIFEDGFGIRVSNLKQLWDDEKVEAKASYAGGNEQDLFDG